MKNTHIIATVFLLITMRIAQGKPRDNPCSHGAPFTNSSGSTLICGGGFVPTGTKFDRCPKDYFCNFKFAAFDGPALCCPKEPVCKHCKSIVQGQRCGQDGGPYRRNCTECCQSSSSKCAEWRCDAGGWLCQKSCSTGNGGGLEKCPRGNPLAGVFCGRGQHRQNCPKGYFCNTDPTDRFAVCCLEGHVTDRCDVVKEGDFMPIACGPGQSVTIISALYGRTSNPECGNPITSKREVSRTCNNHGCLIQATNAVFGTPDPSCDGNQVFLSACWTC